jgi:antitoxin ChpS
LKGIFLFGSRARGDFAPYSDVDVAVVLDDGVKRVSELTALSRIAYDVFLETGAEIQPWVFAEGEWDRPCKSSSYELVLAAKRDSRAIQI